MDYPRDWWQKENDAFDERYHHLADTLDEAEYTAMRDYGINQKYDKDDTSNDRTEELLAGYKAEKEASPESEHFIWIAWGKSDDPAVKYEFSTQEELDAFMWGVESSSGWERFKRGTTAREAAYGCYATP